MSELTISERFRGFLPVVVDIETGGFESATNPILEIAAVFIDTDENGQLVRGESVHHAVHPFDGSEINPESLKFTGIDLEADRGAVNEADAVTDIFRAIRREIKRQDCKRGIITAHNAFFDHGFLKAAVERNDIKRDPFHPFSAFDTATLAGVALGHTVLARACQLAHIDYDNELAHSALYDAEVTADLFCTIANKWGVR